MIVVAILALSLVVLSLIVTALGEGLPAIPSDVVTIINEAISLISQGAGVFWNFVHPGPVKALIGLTLAAIGIYEGYKLVMWIVKKIPMFGVSD